MRAVVQRVVAARVEVAGELVGSISRGLCVFVGAGKDDLEADLASTASRIVHMRIFPDPKGKLGLSVKDIGGSVLVVSQFTVYGDMRRGRRPSFDAAMHPIPARDAYERFVALLRAHDVFVATGRFAADMRVFVDNDGPVTILVDSAKAF
ncbi:MAG: D-tyrosyl-tRNA(Tyr) deacylase [Myxococcales bacterium]|nr:D-tyrosyl-tRNA(Tyr) deacylase [Myxococcales bacterium]